MNLVEQYQRLSDIRDLSETFSFSVMPFSESDLWQGVKSSIKSGYLIVYRIDELFHDEEYLNENTVSYVMNKALQYKKDYSRLVFKTSYREHKAFISGNVFVFKNRKDAERALSNFLLYARSRHGSFAKQVIGKAIQVPAAF